MKYTACLLLIALWPSFSFAQTATEGNTDHPELKVPYTKDSLQVVQKNIAGKKAIMLDVRSQAEWDATHLKIAKFIPSSVIRSAGKARAKELQAINKKKIVYVHCKVGGRAGVCAQILGELGYDVRPLKINYEELVEFGFEEIKKKTVEE